MHSQVSGARSSRPRGRASIGAGWERGGNKSCPGMSLLDACVPPTSAPFAGNSRWERGSRRGRDTAYGTEDQRFESSRARWRTRCEPAGSRHYGESGRRSLSPSLVSAAFHIPASGGGARSAPWRTTPTNSVERGNDSLHSIASVRHCSRRSAFWSHPRTGRTSRRQSGGYGCSRRCSAAARTCSRRGGRVLRSRTVEVPRGR